jgi:hypothetical protein
MSRAARFKVEQRGGATRVTFAGRFDEEVDFELLKTQLRGQVEFHLGAVTRVNSTGVRAWVDFVHALPAVTELAFTHCSPAVVTQLNTIDNFRGPARVTSLLAPYACEACALEELQLIELGAIGPSGTLPEFHCARCGATMVFEDLPERYLAFLK